MQSSNDNYNDGTNSQISHTIDTISQILEEIIQESESQEIPSDQPPEIKECINKFTIKKVPSITINKYLRRIVKYANPEQSTLIMVLIYIDKICENSNVQLTANNIHRLITSYATLACDCDASNPSICCDVSKATPTTIIIPVPPNASD